MGPATRYTLRRNTASINEDLIFDFDVDNLFMTIQSSIPLVFVCVKNSHLKVDQLLHIMWQIVKDDQGMHLPTSHFSRAFLMNTIFS